MARMPESTHPVMALPFRDRIRHDLHLTPQVVRFRNSSRVK